MGARVPVVAVLGNHDHAVSATAQNFSAEAQAAIEWTRGRLDRDQRRFLANLPLTAEEDDRLYVHAEASHPEVTVLPNGSSKSTC